MTPTPVKTPAPVTTPAPVQTKTPVKTPVQTKTPTAVKTPTPTKTPTTTTTPTRTAPSSRSITAPGKAPPRLGKFRYTRTAKLPKGQYVRRLQWRQGQVYKQIDLQTGKTRTTKNPVGSGVLPGTTPQDTLKIIGFQKRPAKNRSFEMGKVKGFVEGRRKISFAVSKRGKFN
tara:strand:+ start:1090 stop:1605 length:516 start_codon:yes stop_codon:yes gene_type:complete